VSRESLELEPGVWPPAIGDRVCPSCGGRTACAFERQQLEPLARMQVGHVADEVQVVLRSRQELLSRAMVQATVTRAGRAAAPSTDVVLGKYQLIRPLIVGGMAEVFLAKQTGIEKPVALKRIHRKTLESQHLAIDMFLNEAKIAARIVHPNITQVFDVGEERGALFLAMEYVHGKDLRLVMKALRDRSELAPLAQSIYILREVASALHHAYWSTDLERRQLKVVHRDVSPHNVLLSYDGSVKLADFGVALSSVTTDKEKMVTGKWGYMSPEQSRGEPLDHRSDLFALGIILYQLCSGLHPFGGGRPREIAARLRQGAYVPLNMMTRHVPSALVKLIDELLQPTRERRPDTGADVAVRLERIAVEEGFEIGPARLAGWLATQFPTETALPIDSAGSFELLPQSGSHLRTPTGSLRYTPTGSPPPSWSTAPDDIIDMLPTTVLPASPDRTQPDLEYEAVEVDSSVEVVSETESEPTPAPAPAPAATPAPVPASSLASALADTSMATPAPRRKSLLQFEAPKPKRSVRTSLFVLLLITMTAAAVYLGFLIVETL
jgi:serine/threonine-protein kinase